LILGQRGCFWTPFAWEVTAVKTQAPILLRLKRWKGYISALLSTTVAEEAAGPLNSRMSAGVEAPQCMALFCTQVYTYNISFSFTVLECA
jgi:hypothetical protein